MLTSLTKLYKEKYMITEIYIVSGFLGAGKTTLIQKMIEKSFIGKNLVIIENDFGEMNIDAILLKSNGFKVEALNEGCICCTISGDFKKSLEKIAETYHPDVIIIEPSGVGKLSDVVKACEEFMINESIYRLKKITIVDVKKYNKYLANFGEFYENQVVNADMIFLSRTEQYPDYIEKTVRGIKVLSPQVHIISSPWEDSSVMDLIDEDSVADREGSTIMECTHADHKGCSHSHHSHEADNLFDTVTIELDNKIGIENLTDKIKQLEGIKYGTILRAKGFLKSNSNSFEVQYVSGELHIRESLIEGNSLCIIGKDLEHQLLMDLFAN